MVGKPRSKKQTGQLLSPKFDRRFLDVYGGRILSDPKVALTELVANAWDAYACQVDVRLPNSETGQRFEIADDGSGMTATEFDERFMTVYYDRTRDQNKKIEKPPGKEDLPNRRPYGRNGKGRMGAFCFAGDEFFVESHKGGKFALFRVYKTDTGLLPFGTEKVQEGASARHGTLIYGHVPSNDIGFSAESLRTELGLRFLSDPNFTVVVDGEKVTFEDIPSESAKWVDLTIADVGTVRVLAIDTNKGDRSTKLHGIAWQVGGRLVGNADWKTFDDQNFLDGRTKAAKRFTFIVQADCLEGSVAADWSGFVEDQPAVDASTAAVNEHIRDFLLQHSAEEREEKRQTLRQRNAAHLKAMDLQAAELWDEFVQKLQVECPSLNNKELESVVTILAKLESAKSKYALLDKLQYVSSDDLDSLNNLLQDWTIKTAKEVLDELQRRLTTITRLEEKMLCDDTDELHDLQPIFDHGLWIFGPQYEAIEFTSNQSMATVIQKVFKGSKLVGSKNRPDYVMVPNGSLSAYSRPSYATTEPFGEVGYAHVAIVELKKPSIAVGQEEKQQCLKYVTELANKGQIQNSTSVDCFLLGKTMKAHQDSRLQEGPTQNWQVLPLTYQIVLERAKSRTLNLLNKVRNAPFLQGAEIDKYMQPTDGLKIQMTILDDGTKLVAERPDVLPKV